MSAARRAVAEVATRVEEQASLFRFRFKQQFGILDPIKILPYRGYGTPELLYVKGRVLETRGITPNTDHCSGWQNFRNMLRRFTSNHIPRARVRVTFHEMEQIVTTDKNGFFNVYIKPQRPLAVDQVWHDVGLKLLEPKAAGQGETYATGRVLAPPSDAEFGVISDLDDTVVETFATDLFSMLHIVFFNNARTRLPFKGIAAFYQALQRGSQGTCHNPMFYVSSSAWNIYDLFDEFMAIHDIPEGPLLLREYSLDRERLLVLGHKEYKLERIRRLLDLYPKLPFVLIGDSGQRDPEIYYQSVRENPGRILAIYIRDVSSAQRDREVEAIAEGVQQLGVEMVFAPDTVAAAEHASRHGLIRPETLPAVRAEKAREDQP